MEINSYNILINDSKFFHQPINDSIKRYDTGDDYTTGCLLHYSYFKNSYHLLAFDLEKHKALDVDAMAIQQTEFNEDLKTNSQICTIFENSKERILEFYKETAIVF